MTNRVIVIGIISCLVVGLVFLGLQVKNLRAEVSQLSTAPAVAAQPAANQQQIKPKFTRPNGWWTSFNRQWDPYAEFAQIQRQMNRLFNQQFPGELWARGANTDVYNLSTDIKDAKDKYVINMDIPGMDKDNISVEVKNNALLVSGERSNQIENENTNYYKQERSFGYFSQSLPLPADANSSAISVNYKKGVLTIEIPKLAKAETQQGESTKIKVN